MSLRVKPLGWLVEFYFTCLYVLFCFVVFIFAVFLIELKLSCWIAWGSCLYGALVEFLMSIAVVWEDRGRKDGMKE